ncbi:MAG: asparagine synthase (glutamine-hydrolyzing) [Vicinamibacterales bacterium]
MCGIAGFAGTGTLADAEAMAAVLQHRGPDGHGSYFDPHFRVGLGHQRLAVIDPASGHQPMWNEDRSVAVVFNGEIYNAAELRQELVARGHRFETDHSDTEVLVHGYEEWRTELPIRLNGMFAFAVYDSASGQLLLARDRFGEKPLYYTLGRGFFAFASELTALREHPAVRFATDAKSVQKLFAYGYIPAPRTMIRGVHKLPAGWTLRYDCRAEAAVTKPYWTFQLECDDALEHAPEETLVEELRALLRQSVQRRLVSDVPLGIFLSGGIDSATVLAFAARQIPAEQLSTFTVGFVERSYDESVAAERLAKWFGTRHHSTQLSLDNAHELMQDVISRLDEPLGDPSILPTHLLCRFARRSVTVALSGDGGDELFAGYDPFLALGMAKLYTRVVPRTLHRTVRRLAARLPHSDSYMSWDFRLRRALTGLDYSQQIWNPVWMSPIEPKAMHRYFEDPLPPEELYEEAIDAWSSSTQTDPLSRSLEFFTKLYLQNDILPKVDRASMMVSLESRAVFLDNDLVDFCRRLPNSWKLRRGVRKYLLRRALAGMVPNEVLNRRKKGFGIPIDTWLRHLPFPEATVSLPGIRQDGLRQAWNQHQGRQHDERLLLWTWVVAHTWVNSVGEVVLQ